jgi:uncharacterized protein YcbK (DUF882 family)
MNRRKFLTFGAAALTASSVRRPAFAKSLAPTRSLSFYNIHTSEKLDVAYFADGCCVPVAVAEIRKILRDYRTGEEHDIDLGLLDLLVTLRDKMEASGPFHVISGYRSPATNEKLHAASGGVARNSLHMKGMAIDIRLPGRDLVQIRNAALNLQAGGVGYYPENDFVHVDVGRVRHWGASA